MKKKSLAPLILITFFLLLVAVFILVINRAQPRSGFIRQTGGPWEYQAAIEGQGVVIAFGKTEKSARLQIVKDNYELSFSQGLEVSPKIVEEGQTLIYRTAEGEAEIHYQITEAGVKEDIILTHSSQIKPSYFYDLDLEKLIFKRGVDGQWYFYDEDTTDYSYPVFVIPQPLMIDAQGNRSYKIEIDIKVQEGRRFLELRPDLGWLYAPERAFPIKIDPTVEALAYGQKGQHRKTCWVKNYLERHPDYANLPVYGRSENSIHFLKPNGQVEAKFLDTRIHYRDEEGNWQPLDLTLMRSGDEYGVPGAPFRIKTNGLIYNTQGQYAHQTLRVGIFDPQSQEFTPIAHLGERTFSENVSTWEKGNLSHKIVLTEKGLFEHLEVLGPGGIDPREEGWLVMEARLEGVHFPDSWLEGTFSFENYLFPPPVSWDANQRSVETKRYALSKAGVQYFYTGIPVRALNWASFPIVIDPDLTSYPSMDGSMNGNSGIYVKTPNAMPDTTDTDDSSQPVTFKVGQQYTSSYSVYRPVLRFNTSSLPDVADISEVELYMTVQHTWWVQTHFTVQIVDYDWSDYEEMTDYSASLNSAWTGCIGARNYVTWRSTSGLSIDSTYANTEAMSNSWVSKTGNTYYCLTSSRDRGDSAPTGYEYLVLYSTDYSGTTVAPYLSVSYFIQTRGCGFTKSNDNSEIMINWQSEGMGASVFQVQKSTDREAFIDLNTVGGGVSSTTDSSVSPGHQYQYRVRARYVDFDAEWCTTSELDLQTGKMDFEGVKMEGIRVN